MLGDRAVALLEEASSSAGALLFLTGAGVSAESGIPTFRGPEGYWRVGSRNYHPTELATLEAFSALPDEVWAWYLFRRAVCRAARPNAAHEALAQLESRLGDRFLLVTQNVDGLHLRAGNTPSRTYQIHGNIDFMRCARECSTALSPIPAALGDAWPRDRRVGDAERALLRCPRCEGPARPHVLWFDESYDEPLFRYRSALAAADRAALLVVVGTSGATTLPARICDTAARRAIPFVVVDPDETPFATLARQTPRGAHLVGTAATLIPALASNL